MYWFACVNDNSQMHKDLYLIALKSCKKNTTLTPILIYSGNDNNFLDTINKSNIKIIRHDLLFSNKVNFNNKTDGWKKIGTGAFLRIDIPQICKKHNIKDKFVLYTDTDVLFLKDCVKELKTYEPKYLGVCPETNIDDYKFFNSGVMLINIKNMLQTYNDFTNFIEENKYDYSKYNIYDTLDQGALQCFYKDKVDKLPTYFNHKPYWGVNKDAVIIHYHGPKYFNIRNYLMGNIQNQMNYKYLYDKIDNNTWFIYLYLYEYFCDDLDWKYYVQSYKDLKNINNFYDAIIHWNQNGKRENRICKKESEK
jgi:hypothetical protein